MEKPTVTPYENSTASKREQVEEMFDNISGNYDFINRFLTLGIDRGWRRKAIKEAGANQPKSILDVATGTADIAIAASKLKPQSIVGIDISQKMLDIGQKKIDKLNLGKLIQLQNCDSENLPFSDNSFDAVTVAFGVRNFEHLEKGLTEIFRVINPNGKLVILELSKPHMFPVKQLFGFYSNFVLPTVGGMISGDKRAYTYLPESVKKFPEGQEMVNILDKIGFKQTKCKSLTFGISSLYTGIK